MSKISALLKPFNSTVFYNDKIFNINNGHNIFFEFDRILNARGIDIHTLDKAKAADKYIFADVPYPWEIAMWLKLLTIPKNKKILFCFESPIVNPFNHLSFFYMHFGTIYTWNDELVKSIKKVRKLYVPQVEIQKSIKNIPFNKKKLLVCINSKKSSIVFLRLLSPFKKDLYRERCDAIDYFEKNNSQEFDLYGKGWNLPGRFNLVEKLLKVKKLSVYRGEIPVNEKNSVLAKYKFCLCFENTSAPGYITEKIFDCFASGTVPIYKGAPNISKYIPKSAYIDMNQFSTYGELVTFLEKMTKERYQGYLTAASLFVKDKKSERKWGKQSFIDIVVSNILEK